MTTTIALTDEIGLKKREWTVIDTPGLDDIGKHYNLKVTSGSGLQFSRCEFTIPGHVPISQRMRAVVTEKRGMDDWTLFDGFVVSASFLYDPDAQAFDAKTVSPTTDEYLTLGLSANLNAWNYRSFEPYRTTLTRLAIPYRELTRQMAARFREGGLTYADIVDTLYTEYGVLVDGVLLYGLYGFRNTIALTADDIISRSMTAVNIGNLPGGLARVNIRSPYVVVEVNRPLLGTVNYKDAIDPAQPKRELVFKDNNLKAGEKSSDYQIAVDGWLAERNAAEINLTLPLRLDVAARTKLTFPADFWAFNLDWTVTKATHNWANRTTEVTASVLQPGGRNALG